MNKLFYFLHSIFEGKLCMLGNYSWFCCLRTLKKQNFHEHYQSVQQFGPRSGPTHFVVPDLGPSCFQRLSADEKSRKQGNSFLLL